jgi:hypothetical protein
MAGLVFNPQIDANQAKQGQEDAEGGRTYPSRYGWQEPAMKKSKKAIARSSGTHPTWEDIRPDGCHPVKQAQRAQSQDKATTLSPGVLLNEGYKMGVAEIMTRNTTPLCSSA